MPSLTNIVLSLVVLALLVFIVWHQSQEKRKNIRSFWISMLLIGILCVLSFSHIVISSATNIVLLVGCGLLGFVIGFASGRLAKVQVDQAKHALIVQGTTTSIIVWVVLFIIKQAFHLLSKGGTTGLLIDLIGSNVLFLTACSVLGMHLYWYWRYRAAFKVNVGDGAGGSER